MWITGTIIVPLAAHPSHDASWSPGPLALPWGEQATDAPLRSTYLAFRAVHALYDPDRRLHRTLDTTVHDDPEGRLRLVALECLHAHPDAAPGPALGIAHIEAEGKGAVASLTRFVRPAGYVDGETPLGSLCPELFGVESINGGRRTGSALLQVGGIADDLEVDQTLWQLASLNPAPPDADDIRRPPVIRLSASWRALVLRDGTSFAWCADEADPFRQRAETLVSTVYTDVLLLAQLQRLVLTGLADQLVP